MGDCKIRVFKMREPRNPRFPWGGVYPCCPMMGNGGGWPTWMGALRQAERHLREMHGE